MKEKKCILAINSLDRGQLTYKTYLQQRKEVFVKQIALIINKKLLLQSFQTHNIEEAFCMSHFPTKVKLLINVQRWRNSYSLKENCLKIESAPTFSTVHR